MPILVVVRWSRSPVHYVVNARIDRLRVHVIFKDLCRVKFRFGTLTQEEGAVTRVASTVVVGFLRKALRLNDRRLRGEVNLYLAVNEFRARGRLFSAYRVTRRAFF